MSSKRVHYKHESKPWLTACHRYYANCVKTTTDLEAFLKDPRACKRCLKALKKKGKQDE